MINSKKRPYGLSFDGKASTRKLIKYLQPFSNANKPSGSPLLNKKHDSIKIENIESSPEITNLN